MSNFQIIICCYFGVGVLSLPLVVYDFYCLKKRQFRLTDIFDSLLLSALIILFGSMACIFLHVESDLYNRTILKRCFWLPILYFLPILSLSLLWFME